MAAIPPHFEFWLDVLEVLNGNGHDIAVFFPRYTITPRGRYPTQLRQAIEGLRYILNETGRSPSNVMIGGDSAGGNLAMATLLHLTHPHPEIEPLSLSESLAGAFGFAPWINFNRDWPSMEENLYKDIIPLSSLENWSTAYLNNGEGDSWSEPSRAPLEWWKDVKTERILILAGADEILLSPIEDFATKIKVRFSLVHDSFALVTLRLLLTFHSLSSRTPLTLLALTSLMIHTCMSMLGPRRERKLATSCGNGSPRDSD